MATTDRHGFLLWSSGFTQSDTLLNGLLLKLETKLGLSVVSRTETAPVGGDADGDCYIMPGGTLTGAFSSFSEHDVVILRDGTWYAFTPISGWPAWVEDDSEGVMFNGTSWVIVSKDLPKDKLDATADPTVDNDTDEDYSVGSHWYNVTDDKAFVCLDATAGAAVWKETTGAGGQLDKLDATADPAVTNDSSEGYSIGSRWINVTADTAFTCVDASVGAAVWVGAGGLSEAQVDARVVAVASGAKREMFYADVGLHAIAASGGSPASAGTVFPVATTAVRVLNYSPSAFNDSFFTWVPPPSWDQGTLRFRLHWLPSNTNTGNISFGVGHSFGADLEAASANATLGIITDAGGGTALNIQTSPWISGVITELAIGDVLMGKLYGRGGGGGFTFTGTTHLMALEMEYITNAPTDD